MMKAPSPHMTLSLAHPFVAMFSPSVRDAVDFREDGKGLYLCWPTARFFAVVLRVAAFSQQTRAAGVVGDLSRH